MEIKEKHYIKKCHCGTEIIYTRSDCYYDAPSDLYSLYCPSCHYRYKYQYRVYGDLFDEEYEEDSIDKDKEIERLNNIINDINTQLTYLETYSSKEEVFEDMKRRLDRIENIVNRK